MSTPSGAYCAMLAAASRACLGSRVGSFAKGVQSRHALRFLPLRARSGRTASSTPTVMAAKFGKNGERVYPAEGKVEVDGKFYRRCAAALVFNLNGDVLLGERLDRSGSWGMPQGGVEVRRARPDRGRSELLFFPGRHRARATFLTTPPRRVW